MKYVVWEWGDRKVSSGKVLEEDTYVISVEMKILDEVHHIVLPKGSFKFKYFNTEKEAQDYLENVR